jgi:MscS family membrane protein
MKIRPMRRPPMRPEVSAALTSPIGTVLPNDPEVRALLVLLASVLLAFCSEYLTRQTLGRVARRTVSNIDDQIMDIMRRPIAVTCLLVGAWYAYVSLKKGVPEDVPRVWKAVLLSVGIVVWAKVVILGGRVVLFDAQLKKGKKKLVAKRLLPIFDMTLKVVVVSLAGYYIMLAWGINVSGWIASAGILGVAVGFAAQETLGNIMAGVSIMADAPYKLGDWLLLDSGQRGRVTDIGLRSTRILTLDEVEMIVPNSIMANSIVTNESGGPSERLRVRLPIGVAYGSDLEQVKAVIVAIAVEVPGVIGDEPGRNPSVKFVEFGGSSLNLELQIWLTSPVLRPQIVDKLNMAIYAALNKAEIEIPFETHSVYIHQEGE